MARKLKVYYQRAANLGDWLPPVLIERLFGREVIHAPTSRADLVATGSVLETVFRKAWKRRLYGRFSPVVLWGPGFIADGAVLEPKRIDPLMLRGPNSGRRIKGWADGPVGDPVLLADRILRGGKPAKRHACGIIPHISDQSHPAIAALAGETAGATIVDLAAPIDEVLDTIAACDRVISTSLHGLVVADSFGIPNVWITAGGSLFGGAWKFQDYFAGIGRSDAPALPFDINDPAVRSAILSDWDSHAMRPGNLEPQKDRMIAAFNSRWGR